MDLAVFPNSIRNKFTLTEREHATAILIKDFPNELTFVIIWRVPWSGGFPSGV